LVAAPFCNNAGSLASNLRATCAAQGSVFTTGATVVQGASVGAGVVVTVVWTTVVQGASVGAGVVVTVV